MTGKPRKLYHYTTGIYGRMIAESGQIRTSTTRTLAPGERPLVWCSLNPSWEPTAAKGLGTRNAATGQIVLLRTLTLEEHERATGGLIRFEVDPSAAPLTWFAACMEAGTPPDLIRHMEQRAIELASDKDDWRASLTAIPASLWISMEVYDFREKVWRSTEILSIRRIA